jgi:hypothetical protein
MSLTEGLLFTFVLTAFVSFWLLLAAQLTSYTVFCNCGCSKARHAMVFAGLDSVEVIRIRELLTENCPICRDRRSKRQSTIANPQSKGGAHDR